MLYTIISLEDVFYKNEGKKSSELVCITNPYEYIRNDEYSKFCKKFRIYEGRNNEYNRSSHSGDNSGNH